MYRKTFTILKTYKSRWERLDEIVINKVIKYIVYDQTFNLGQLYNTMFKTFLLLCLILNNSQ